MCNCLMLSLTCFHKPLLAFSAPCGFTNVDLVFAFDSSTSVKRENFLLMLNFAKDVLRDADIDSGSVRVGALVYSSGAQIQFDLQTYQNKRDILEAFNRIPYIPGRTNTAEALRSIRTKMFKSRKGDRDDVEDVVILITDSASDRNVRKTIPEARKLWARKIQVNTVGIGLRDTRELDGMATPPASKNSYAVRSFSELAGLPARILEGRCEGSGHVHMFKYKLAVGSLELWVLTITYVGNTIFYSLYI